MPDREVGTVRDLLYYQYAKIIARRAFGAGDGREAKARHYGFIKKTFRDLKSGSKTWSQIAREDWQLVESEKKCVYCGSTYGLSREHIVPRSLRINERCPTCDTIQSIHNQVWSCRDCNARKGKMGLYAFYQTLFPDDPKFYDMIPPLAEKKYLKTIYACHQCAGTLDAKDLDGDGILTVMDLDYVVQYQRNPHQTTRYTSTPY